MTKAERTRQFIIEQAAPLFMKKGVAGTAMSDIMEATKLAKGSLYVHFENKEELSYAVVDYNLGLFGKKMSEGSNKQPTAKGKILLLLKILGDPLNTPLEGGCPMLNFGTEADDTNPVILEKVSQFITGRKQHITDLVEKGIKDGEFKNTWDAKDFSIKMLALLEGGILLCRVANNNDAMKAIVRMLKKEINEQGI
ncbi:TetR/AcrR family transcriptional regulator [Mucilaginibacter sp.]|uniref:TetR/AcrR family transcriptional regulator n=1 Tax=Mucilaginibacter sp. TaxID=1882438 RepID=UPI0026253975|nr:TetR/AcrR family transcriptional regulator [Mucilaginibacter sp.]MDB4926753.1 transcriptional regulator, TetR family [Mucilaginibacter sp.]